MVHMLQTHNEKFDAFALLLGRVGFFARGFVWAAVGGIAISAAFTGASTQGTQGAIEVIADNNGGVVFLILIVIGLLCYSSWRFIEGLFGLQIKPNQPPFVQVVRGIITPFCSCIAYIVFAITSIVDVRNGISGDHENKDSITSRMVQYTIGEVFLVIVSFFLFVTAIMWVVDLIKAKLFEDIDLKSLNRCTPVKILVVTFAYLGTFGRAVLFALLAVLLLRATFDHDIRGGGFGVALQQLQYNTPARIFLVFLGFLIFLFGCFSVCQAVFKKFYRYKPHFSENKHSDQAEAVIKQAFKKGVSKEMRFETQYDKEDDMNAKAIAMDETHPEVKQKKDRLAKEAHDVSQHNRDENNNNPPPAPPTN